MEQNWATTVSGYNLFDVASAFQKSIRRCLEEEAMFWAMKTEKILEENPDAMLNPANIQIGPNGETKMNL